MKPTILNAMTVDVEEHFQVSAFDQVVRRKDWAGLESRVESNTDRMLDLFDETGVRATFFVLGWLAERYPSLPRRIVERGHEVGCHGFAHRLIYDQNPEEFREETLRAKRVIEDAAGVAVRGYRAASFSITLRSLWALDVLVETGFEYDSSIFPVYHDRYGIPGAPRTIFRLKTPSGRQLVEIPPSTIRVAGTAVAVAGGGYLRLYPLPLSRLAIRRLNQRERIPAIVYVHPWELDPEQPRIDAPWARRLRHYSGLRATSAKLRTLMQSFAFGTMRDVLAAQGSLPETVLG